MGERRGRHAGLIGGIRAGGNGRDIRDGPTGAVGRRINRMTLDDLEAAALTLDPKGRARLASRLLQSLEDLSPEENARIWAEEAQRRARALESGTLSDRPADEVFRDARARI